MIFSNPYLLFGLFALLIPILIHLFNFRRYKTVYFSNVKMLDDIQKKTKRKSRIQQLIVLALRLLGITALVFAFAQPFMKNGSQNKTGGNIVSIFVDNSFSMDANSENTSSLYEAIDAAKTIVRDFNYDDDFVLTTQNFSGEESHILNRDQMLELLDRVAISPNSHSFKDIRAFEANTSQRSTKSNVVRFYISDFQKNAFDFTALRGDSSMHIGLVPSKSVEKANVAVDSCWFVSPVFRVDNVVTLIARIHNYGNENVQKVPVKLHVNEKQKAIAAVDVDARSYVDCRLSYRIDEKGTNLGRISIEDAPITFDDELFFTYDVSDNSNVICVYNKEPNRFVNALYGKDSVFNYQSMDYRQINYTQLRECDIVVLNEVPSISSGLSDELSKFVDAGGTILVFPAKEPDNTVNAFLKRLGSGYYGKLSKAAVKCGKINSESLYFRNVIENGGERIDLPSTLQHFEIGSGSSGMESIMSLENGAPLLAVWNVGNGRVVLSSVALDDEFGNCHRHAMFFVPLHNIGILTTSQQRLYNVIGVDNMQTVNFQGDHSDDVLTMRARKNKEEFIPEQRKSGNSTALYFHDQVHVSDWFDLFKDKQNMGALAFNFSRKESDMDFYSEEELNKAASEIGGNINVVSTNAKNIAKAATEQLNGRPLWPLFLIMSLLCFLAEIAVLRFWNKPSVTEDNKML